MPTKRNTARRDTGASGPRGIRYANVQAPTVVKKKTVKKRASKPTSKIASKKLKKNVDDDNPNVDDNLNDSNDSNNSENSDDADNQDDVDNLVGDGIKDDNLDDTGDSNTFVYHPTFLKDDGTGLDLNVTYECDGDVKQMTITNKKGKIEVLDENFKYQPSKAHDPKFNLYFGIVYKNNKPKKIVEYDLLMKESLKLDSPSFKASQKKYKKAAIATAKEVLNPPVSVESPHKRIVSYKTIGSTSPTTKRTFSSPEKPSVGVDAKPTTTTHPQNLFSNLKVPSSSQQASQSVVDVKKTATQPHPKEKSKQKQPPPPKTVQNQQFDVATTQEQHPSAFSTLDDTLTWLQSLDKTTTTTQQQNIKPPLEANTNQQTGIGLNAPLFEQKQPEIIKKPPPKELQQLSQQMQPNQVANQGQQQPMKERSVQPFTTQQQPATKPPIEGKSIKQQIKELYAPLLAQHQPTYITNLPPLVRPSSETMQSFLDSSQAQNQTVQQPQFAASTKQQIIPASQQMQPRQEASQGLSQTMKERSAQPRTTEQHPAAEATPNKPKYMKARPEHLKQFLQTLVITDEPDTSTVEHPTPLSLPTEIDTSIPFSTPTKNVEIYSQLAKTNKALSPSAVEYRKNYAQTRPSIIDDKNENDEDNVHSQDMELSSESEEQSKKEERNCMRKELKKDKYKSLKTIEIYNISQYVRGSLWRRAKLLDDKQVSNEVLKLYQLENIDESRAETYPDMMDLVKQNMNYRRSYSIKKVRELLLEKLLDNNMFDISLLAEFYKNDLNTEVSDEVKNAYFIFINDFCTMVSSHWKKYLKEHCDDRANATYHTNLTKSDEAFTYLVLICHYDKRVEDVKTIQEVGLESWNNERMKGKSGKHEIQANRDIYVALHTRISQHRENQASFDYWCNIFFDKYFETKPASINKSNRKELVPSVNMTSVPVATDFD